MTNQTPTTSASKGNGRKRLIGDVTSKENTTATYSVDFYYFSFLAARGGWDVCGERNRLREGQGRSK
jgi:hypothetical protein